jgi:branched-chain amino acid transport system ATP-binding protein
MLEAKALKIAHGDAVAVWEVSLSVGDGELVCIVGPNGAGKTTLVNAIARLIPIQGGSLQLAGKDIAHLGPKDVCHLGVALIPEGRRLFGGMTVEENLEVGCYRPAARSFRNQSLERVYDVFPILRERRLQRAGTLSGGQQQMVAIARALMARPSLLLIDEPSLGLAPFVVEQVFGVIRTIHEAGISVLLIEQNVAQALLIAQRAYVLEGGRIVSEGAPDQLLSQPHVRAAYLGANA